MSKSLGHIFGGETRVNRVAPSPAQYQVEQFLPLFRLHSAKGTEEMHF